jgi:hypothetical protein
MILPSGSRVALLVVTALPLVLMPLGPTMLGILLVAVELAVPVSAGAAIMRARRAQQAAQVVAVADPATVALLRRVVPALRMRRPMATIEAQVRWRAAGEARRQRFRLVP